MIPRRVTPPVGAVVDLAEMKAHLRVLNDDEDGLISSLIAAAESHLDGWRGVLGRCILPQQWAVDYPEAGCWRLPFPDVTSVTVSAGVGILTHDGLGAIVTLTEAATVTMDVQMPSETVDAVRLIVKLLVGHWYANREAAGADTLSAAPLAVDALMTPLRWVVP